MNILIIKNSSMKILFYFSLISSFLFSVIFYDTTTGLDWERYINSVGVFLNSSEVAFDGQGVLYYSILSKSIKLFLNFANESNVYLVLSFAIHITNFLLFTIGIYGLLNLIKKRYSDNNQNLIYLTLSLICFFPPSFYLRWTMKPEIMAFTLLPWSIYFLDKYFQNRQINYFILSVSSVSLLLSQKGSVTGMILICLFFLYFNQILNIRKNLYLILSGFFTSIFLLIENYNIFNIWLFAKPTSHSLELVNKWNNTAPFDFFINIDFKNLLENPFKFTHSDSLISITLLDTLSDYFTFFWKHQEKTNLIAYNKIEFTDNFLIQNFLSEYISIIFTLMFYIFIFIFIFTKTENWKIVSFPLSGLLVLTLNSLGFPSRNFDPLTGDLFKVHYYSYLLCVSFAFILYFLISKYNIFKLASLFLLPIFLLSMGFPKNLDADYKNQIYEKINIVNYCYEKNSNNNSCLEVSNQTHEDSLKYLPNYQKSKNKSKKIFFNNSLIIISFLLYAKSKFQ